MFLRDELKSNFWIVIAFFPLSVHARGIGYMQNMRAFKTVCPLRNELHLDITTAVKVTMSVQFQICLGVGWRGFELSFVQFVTFVL